MRKRIFKWLLLAVIAVATVLTLTACGEIYSVNDIRYTAPGGSNIDLYQASAAIGDNYILRVRNKQLGLFKRESSGLANVGFYDTGRGTPTRLVSYGNKFAAFAELTTTVEVSLYDATAATKERFVPSRTMVFKGELFNVEIFGSVMYVTTLFNETHYGGGDGSSVTYIDNNETKAVEYSSIDEYDYRGFIVAAVDLDSLSLKQSPVYICGLSPKKLTIDGNNIYTEFNTFKGKGIRAEKNSTLFSLHDLNSLQYKSGLETSDEIVSHIVSGDNLAVLFVDSGYERGNPAYKFKLRLFNGNMKEQGKYDYKAVVAFEYNKTIYGNNYDCYLTENSLKLMLPDDNGAVAITTLDFSVPKKITKTNSSGPALVKKYSSSKISGTNALVLLSEYSPGSSKLTAVYDRNNAEYIYFAEAEIIKGNIKLFAENGYLYGYRYRSLEEKTFVVYKISGTIQLKYSMTPPGQTYVETAAAAVTGAAARGKEFFFLSNGYVHTYNDGNGAAASGDTRNMFTVSFDSDGGSNVNDIYLEKGDKLTTQMINGLKSYKDGYSLYKWVETDGKKLYNINSDLNLKAVWIAAEDDNDE